VDLIVDTPPLQAYILYANDLYVAHQYISSLGETYTSLSVSLIMHDRTYGKKKQAVEKFIRKYGKVDHSVILNEIDVDYDTLMKIISELRRQGHLNK
jgi:predicted GTPase